MKVICWKLNDSKTLYWFQEEDAYQASDMDYMI